MLLKNYTIIAIKILHSTLEKLYPKKKKRSIFNIILSHIKKQPKLPRNIKLEN